MENKENKYSHWVFTVLELDNAGLPLPIRMENSLEKISDKFVFQMEECPSTLRRHYQGCFITRIRKRQRTVLMELCVELQVEITQLTVSRMQGKWKQAVEYCSKEESRIGEEVFKSQELQREEESEYKGKDISIFNEKGFYPWQDSVHNIIFKDNSFNINPASGREVIWIEDLSGNTGKSLFTKYLCFNNQNITKLAFGSGSQMRTAVVEEGAKQCYIIDIPRKLCNDDYQGNIYSVIEDLKNGFVKSSMYGKPRVLFMEPPLVIIFSNFECPTEKLSVDRWKIYTIINNKLVDIEKERRMVYGYDD